MYVTPYRIVFGNIFIKFGNIIYRQIVGIPLDTNWDPLVDDLFLIRYERYLMIYLSGDNQAVILRHLTQPLDI